MRVKDTGDSTSTDTINYPIGRMHDTAGNIASNAKKALAQHELTWKKVQTYIDKAPGFLQGPLHAVLSAYEQHLRDSYHWQLDYAKALSDGTTAMQDTDTTVSNQFKGFY